jgi:hypothetical protein
MDNIDDIRNSMIISLATCGGMAVDASNGCVSLTVSFPNTNKAECNKEVFKTFKITKVLFQELKDEAYELHLQINEMIIEEETKKAEEDKKEVENKRKREEEKKLRVKEMRPRKRLDNSRDNASTVEKDKKE